MDVFHKEFLFSNKKKTEINAQAFCVSRGGILFEPEYSLVVIDVAQHAKDEALGEFWSGINDKILEGNFVYDSDNKPVSDLVLSWEAGAPNTPENNGDVEDCVDIDLNEQMNDISCDLDRSIVCESKYI